MDESYETWIANLMAGRQSDADMAARAAFRASQARTPVRPQPATSRPAGIESTGPNTWAVSDRGDGLTLFTHLAGPGIPGLIAAR